MKIYSATESKPTTLTCEYIDGSLASQGSIGVKTVKISRDSLHECLMALLNKVFLYLDEEEEDVDKMSDSEIIDLIDYSNNQDGSDVILVLKDDTKEYINNNYPTEVI